MGNEFFKDHPMLGAMFDFDRDGSINASEASGMIAFGTMIADEWVGLYDKGDGGDGDPLDDFDPDYGSGRSKKKHVRESSYDYEDVDSTSRKAVMRAARDEDFDGDVECLVEEALDNGVRFRPDDVIELSYLIWDQDLLVRLISTSKPRFLQEHADELSPQWGSVELEYHEEAFDEEYGDGSTYHVNTPEEDW